MAAEKRTGAVVPTGILRPTAPPEPDPAAEVDEGQGEGLRPEAGLDEAAPKDEPRAPKPRRRKATAERAEKTEGRRLYLSEPVFLRLRLLAMSKKITLSQAAEEVLDRGLPKWDLKRVS